jgi:hypothetical protein
MVIPAFQRVQSVSDRMTYIILRGQWCDVIVLNVLAQKEDKDDELYVIYSQNIT